MTGARQGEAEIAHNRQYDEGSIRCLGHGATVYISFASNGQVHINFSDKYGSHKSNFVPAPKLDTHNEVREFGIHHLL